MALQTVELMDPAAGLVATYASAASGPHTVPMDGGKTFAAVLNGSGGEITVTVATPGADANGNAIADAVFTIANGATRLIPLNPAIYGSASNNNRAQLTFSSASSVTFAAITLP